MEGIDDLLLDILNVEQLEEQISAPLEGIDDLFLRADGFIENEHVASCSEDETYPNFDVSDLEGSDDDSDDEKSADTSVILDDADFNDNLSIKLSKHAAKMKLLEPDSCTAAANLQCT